MVELSTATHEQLVAEVQRLQARLAALAQTPHVSEPPADTVPSHSDAQTESARRIRATFEQSPIGIAHVGLDGRWLLVNEQLCRITGYTREELFERRFQDITYPDDLATDLANVERLLEGAINHYQLEKRYIRKDGSVIWINLAGSLMRDGAGAPDYFIATIEDITERKRTEMELRESEDRFRQAFQLSPVAKVLSLQADGTYLDVNASFERLFGWSRDEIIGHPSPSTAIWCDPAEREVIVAALRAHGYVQDWDVQLRTKTEIRRDVLLSVVPILVKQRPCLLSTLIDITERKQMESAVRVARQRLRILSQHLLEAQEHERRSIARELHDEIGQLLTALKFSLHAINPSDGSPIAAQRREESLGIVDELLQRVRTLSLDLRPAMLDDLGLGPTMEWYVDRLAQRTNVTALFVNDLGDRAVPTTIASACFRVAQEALTNVIRHAEARHITLRLGEQNGVLRMVVQDDGIGFDVSAARARTNDGRSLGLLNMAERVELAGGRMQIDASDGQGTTVQVWFPIAPPKSTTSGHAMKEGQ